MASGAMKAAAKLAGITAATGGLRSITSEHSHLPRMASLTRTAAAASEDVKLVASNSETGIQRPCTEMDDWVFTDGDEFGVNAAEPMRRVIFGGAPTLQEAEEATSELSLVLEKTFLSSPMAADCSSSQINNHVVETKACISSETAIAPAVSPAAVMAFRFLHESSVAKNVVASIACDQNVWEAMLQNEDLQKFLQSQNACVADYDAKSHGDSSEYEESAPPFMDKILQKIKGAVFDMMNYMSEHFQKFFEGGKDFANRVFASPDGTARIGTDTLLEGSIMGLVIMAVFVILMKRDRV